MPVRWHPQRYEAQWQMGCLGHDDRNGGYEIVKFHPTLLATWTTPLKALMTAHRPNQYHTATLAEEEFLL